VVAAMTQYSAHRLSVLRIILVIVIVTMLLPKKDSILCGHRFSIPERAIVESAHQQTSVASRTTRVPSLVLVISCNDRKADLAKFVSAWESFPE
jgi:hypothetical protein